MQRLIDADTLTSLLEEWEEKACNGTENDGSDGTTRVLHPVPTTTREMIDLIAEQPTIEADPVKHGRWEIEMDDMGWNKHTCPYCGYVKRTDIHVHLGWNYCPNCGAEMDGGAEQ